MFEKTKYTKWFVDQKGNIYSKTTYRGDGSLRMLKPNNCSRGYLYARTATGNKQIHRLVARFFVPNPENKPCVNHKDGDKHNNNVENLEWVTHKENTRHAIDNGLNVFFKKNNGANLKYSNSVCEDVLKRVAVGMTYIDAGRKYNMPYSTVAHLVRGSRREI